LNTFVRKFIARFGRCLTTLFGIPFGPGALPTLSPLLALMTSEVVVNVGSLGGAYYGAESRLSVIYEFRSYRLENTVLHCYKDQPVDDV
jgi:hypothetical protein